MQIGIKKLMNNSVFSNRIQYFTALSLQLSEDNYQKKLEDGIKRYA